MTTPGTAVALPMSASLQEEITFAKFLAKSDMLPKAFQQKPESVLWGMRYGRALGLDGVIAMAGVHVIDNKPHPSAAMAGGLIRAAGHRLRVYNTPPTKTHRWGTGVAELTRRDDPDFTYRVEWAVEDAIRAEICRLTAKGELEQYTKSSGWKVGNWQHYPRQMMKARALGEVGRDGATDVLFGLVYLAEEMDEAELDRNGQLVESSSAPTITIPSEWTRETEARPVGEHATEPAEAVDTPAPERITKRTQIDMMRLFSAAGLGDRKSEEQRRQRLRVCELLLTFGAGSPRRGEIFSLATSTDLTESEGHYIVDVLAGYGDRVGETVEALLMEDEAEREREAAEDAREDDES